MYADILPSPRRSRAASAWRSAMWMPTSSRHIAVSGPGPRPAPVTRDQGLRRRDGRPRCPAYHLPAVWRFVFRRRLRGGRGLRRRARRRNPGRTGRGPNPVKVFEADGTETRLASVQFFPYTNLFTGGVRVAAGDLDGDNLAEIVTSVAAGTERRQPGAGLHQAGTQLWEKTAVPQAWRRLHRRGQHGRRRRRRSDRRARKATTPRSSSS